MQLIDGKATAAKIKEEIAAEVKEIIANGGKQPHLAAILVGHDGGSETYVKNKVLACEACGFKSSLIRFEDDVTEEELLATVKKSNEDEFDYYKRHILLENYDEEPEDPGVLSGIIEQKMKEEGVVKGFTKWFDDVGNQSWQECEIVSYDEKGEQAG